MNLTKPNSEDQPDLYDAIVPEKDFIFTKQLTDSVNIGVTILPADSESSVTVDVGIKIEF